MVIASDSRSSKVYHLPHCGHIRNIKATNRISFETEEEARKQGYRVCSHCSRMYKRYLKEKKEIESYARKHAMQVKYRDDAVYIQTNLACWKIVVDGKKHKLLLYHSNNAMWSRLAKQGGIIQHTYHHQGDVSKKTITGYLHYIHSHDDWRIEQFDAYKKLPQDTRKQKQYYKQCKNSSRRKKARYVENLIAQISDSREHKKSRVCM